MSAVPTPQVLQTQVLKPGWASTEFYVLLGSKLIAVLAMFGVVTRTDATTLTGTLTQCGAALGIVIAGVVATIHYVSSRTALKAQTLPAQATAPGDVGGANALGQTL